jgi:hypothetical protein
VPSSPQDDSKLRPAAPPVQDQLNGRGKRVASGPSKLGVNERRGKSRSLAPLGMTNCEIVTTASKSGVEGKKSGGPSRLSVNKPPHSPKRAHWKNSGEWPLEAPLLARGKRGKRVARKERIKRRRSPQLTVHSRQLKEQEGRERFDTPTRSGQAPRTEETQRPQRRRGEWPLEAPLLARDKLWQAGSEWRICGGGVECRS